MIRYLIRRDLPEVLDIEGQCFEFAWTEEDFLDCLRQRNCTGMVVEYADHIIGSVIYRSLKHEFEVLSFAVHPAWQRRRVGAAMVEKLISKLHRQRRKAIKLCVREHNLPAQLFLRSQGFRCVCVDRHMYEPDWGDEDALEFRYDLRDIERPFAAVNRIAEFVKR